MRSPSDPTAAEVEEHEATGHVQYRTWCKHCVAGRGIGQQHRTREEELRAQDGLPVIASDYTFMSQSGAEDGRAKPILVVKDSRTSSVAATFVDAKGPTPYAVKYFTNFLKSLGYKRVVMQSDGEPSIVALKTAAADAAGVECVPRESPVGEHQANGLVENACKEIKRQVRVARSALEEKVGRPLSDSDPVLAWLPRHVGDLMNRYKKGTDGKTPESRRTGKQRRKPAISYGERLYYRMVGENVRGLKVGRYIGHHGRTGSLLVITADGVQRGTGIRRLGPAERWVMDGWDDQRGFPWEVAARRPAERQEALIGEPRLEVPAMPSVAVLPPAERRLYIRKADVEKYGATEGCPGCTCVLLDQPTVLPHTEACRVRLLEMMSKDEQGRTRLEAHSRSRKRRSEVRESGPEVDVTVEEVTGDPGEVEALPEIPEDPQERAAMKRAVVEAPQVPRRTAKSKAQQSGERKRPGQMTMARGPPLAKPKPSPAQGEKRAAETPAEELRDEVTPAEPGAGTSPPSEMQVEGPQPGDVSTLTKAKRQLKALIKRKILDTYEVRSVDITEEDAEAIALMSCEMAAVDVMEIYSPKRLTEAAAQFKLRPGFAVDLCEEKPEGGYWDLRKESDVQEVREWIDKDEPALLTGSPPCHMFSLLQNISWYKLSPEVRERRMKEALNHLHVSCEMYRKQYDAGRWFLHEAPWSATSWKDPEVQELLSREGVRVVRGPMCRWGMMSTDKRGLQGTGYVRKETGWMTNCEALAELLEGECSNQTGKAPWHRHVHLIGGLARQAAIYPPKLVKAVLRCLKTQLEGKGEISSAEFNSSGPIPEEKHLEEAAEMFWDDVNGGWLPPAEVRKARDLELDYLRRQAVYEKRPISECYEVTGKKPIGTRWLDTDKGDPRKPNFRSRLVVREIKAAKAPEDQLPQSLLFSSTPPLEAMRLLCSLWSSQQVSRNGQRLKLGLWDISRAHFYGTPKRTIYIELPDEDKTPGKEECGLLTKSMYGTQDAPAIWQAHYTGILESAGFKRGRSNASVFYREADGVRVVVHGDDFLALGDRTGLDELDALLRKSYELKRLGTLGDEEGDDKEVHFLNRLIRVGTHHNQPAVFLEPDRRHVDLLIRNLGLEQAKGVDTPDVKKSVDQQMLESRSPILGKELSVKYRSSVMRAAYLSQDRPDISHSVKNLSRKMVNPTEASLGDLKRLGRYLKKYPDFSQVFSRQKMPNKLVVQVDSDHAGCAVTRRSTTGMIALFGGHALKHASNVQSTIALSTGESEYYALVKGGSTALGMQSLLADLGLELPVVVESDSNSAKGTVSRIGLGKARHIQTRYLWLQERVSMGHLKVVHVPGKSNRADAFTKSVPGVQMKKTMERSGYIYLGERSKGQMKLLDSEPKGPGPSSATESQNMRE